MTRRRGSFKCELSSDINGLGAGLLRSSAYLGSTTQISTAFGLLVGLGEMCVVRPDVYASRAENTCEELHGGRQQKVAVAC